MSRWWRRLLAVGLLLAGLAGIGLLPLVHGRLVGWWKGEAVYQGRPTSEWAHEVRDRGDASREWRPGKVTRQLSVVTVEMHGSFHTPSAWERGALWLQGRPIPAYIDEPRLPLTSGGPASLGVLRELLRSDDVIVRRVAIDGLHALRDAARPAIPDLLAACTDPDQSVRWGAYYALDGLGETEVPEPRTDDTR